MEHLKSFLKHYIPNFIKYKKSLGYKYDNINHLYLIDKIFYSNNINNFDEIDKIENLLKNELRAKQHKNEIIDLIKFRNMIENKTEESKIKIPKINSNTNKIPHIITENELLFLCNYIDNKYNHNKENYNSIFSVLIRLLYSTGMRINEVISLKLRDLDLFEGKITIRNAKNNKSRVIIVSNSMKKILNKYVLLFSPTIYLFEYNNQKLSYNKLFNSFKKILKELDLDSTFHDFRHTMATTSFNKLLKEGYDEKEILYYLHIYLGHSTIEETEYYLYFNKSIKDNMRLEYDKK